MTNDDILRKAIEKAVKNGWRKEEGMRFHLENLAAAGEPDPLIFSHDFAKSFWGEIPLHCDSCHRVHPTFSDCDCGVGNNQPAWQHHLQQLALAEDRLAYLAKFIN